MVRHSQFGLIRIVFDSFGYEVEGCEREEEPVYCNAKKECHKYVQILININLDVAEYPFQNIQKKKLKHKEYKYKEYADFG